MSDLSPGQQLVSVVVAGLVLLGLIGTVGFLSYHGTIDGQAAIGFFSAISAGVLGVFAVTHGVSTTGKAIERAQSLSDGRTGSTR